MQEGLFLGLLAVIAEIIGTIGGLGSSVLFVPLAQIFLPFQVVLGLTGILHIFSNITKVYLFRSSIKWKITLWFVIPTVFSVIIGAYVTRFMKPHLLEVIMGLFLIGLSALFWFKPQVKVAANQTNAIFGGLSSGFITGLIGSGGAIRGIFLAAYQLEKEVFIATSSLIDLGNDIPRTAVYLSSGYVQSEHYYLIPILFFSALLGSFIGKKIVHRINEGQFKKIVLISIALIGFWMIYANRVEIVALKLI
jgi:uncharacterized protein